MMLLKVAEGPMVSPPAAFVWRVPMESCRDLSGSDLTGQLVGFLRWLAGQGQVDTFEDGLHVIENLESYRAEFMAYQAFLNSRSEAASV